MKTPTLPLWLFTLLLPANAAALCWNLEADTHTSFEQSWLVLQMRISLVVLVAGSALIIYAIRRPAAPLNLLSTSLIVLGGMLLGLLANDTFRCCENPFFYRLGYPLGWIEGNTMLMRLDLPAGAYLLKNFTRIAWSLSAFGLFVDLIFWCNLSLVLHALFALIPKR